VVLDDGESIAASAVILTAPAYGAARLLAPLVPALADALHAIRYVSTTTVSLAYRRAEANLSLKGYGVVIPRAEQRRINACTITSRKFAHRAPDDGLLIRAFVGGSRTPEMLHLDDESLVAVVRDELCAILGIAAEPLFSRIYRWTDSNPQYDVGHLDRVARIRQISPPGLFLAGAAYDGVGLPDCIRQGQVAAAQALAHTGNPYASLSQTAVVASSSRW
jgi:oxygen-dependent protoporphyrinogen oxidase